MKTWQILVLIALALVLVFAFVKHQKTAVTAASTVKVNNTIGGQLAKNVPIYGTAIKAASIVEKPVVGIFNGVNNAVTNGLQHIPVIGGIVSEPTKLVGKAVNGILGELGF